MSLRASAATSHPMTQSSAKRLRKHRPCIRGCTAGSPHSSQPCWSNRVANTGELGPPCTTPVAGELTPPSAMPPARRHGPRRRPIRPALTRGRRTARSWVLSILSPSPRTSASTLPRTPSVMHRSRRACRASWGRRPCRKPYEPSSQSGSSIASNRLATALWTLVASHGGCPIGRWRPSSFSTQTRSTGAAWERPLRRRSGRPRRVSARCAAYPWAVTPSIPAALAFLVWRYASRRQSSSLRGASGVQTRAGSRAACAAIRWSVGVTVAERTVSPVGLSSFSGRPGVACPPVGPVGLRAPPASVRCVATTASLPIAGTFVCHAPPDTLGAPRVRGLPCGLAAGGKPPDAARALGHPGPPSGVVTRRAMARPRARVPPVQTCPALG